MKALRFQPASWTQLHTIHFALKPAMDPVKLGTLVHTHSSQPALSLSLSLWPVSGNDGGDTGSELQMNRLTPWSPPNFLFDSSREIIGDYVKK